MKTTKQKIAICIFLLIVSFGTNHSVFSRVEPASNFQIEIKPTKNGVQLIGKKGCAFATLEVALKDEVPQAIDRNGTTSLENSKAGTDNALPDFLFTIKRTLVPEEVKGMTKKTKYIFVLESIRGTAWTKLSFNKSGTIYQFGVVGK